MLAHNFMTAKDLHITENEQRALVKVLGMLEREELRHEPPGDPTSPNGFNMAHIHHKTDCGTVACIYGWAASLCDWQSRIFSGMPIHDLFLANDGHDQHPLIDITTAQAAIALRNYLTTGNPRWNEALAEVA